MVIGNLREKGFFLMKKVNVVLHEPEIPQNTGNISRTCAATDSALHLIRPLGFEVSDKQLKRAGLDYWQYLDLTYYDGWDDFKSKHPQAEIYFFSTKARRCYTDISYGDNVFLVFGKETAGLPEALLKSDEEHCVRIPMYGDLRSLNLSNSVAIAVYEVLRQQGFDGLNMKGKLFPTEADKEGQKVF